MKAVKRILLVLCLFSMLGFVYGCQDDSGPAEKAGKKIDQMMEDADDKVEDVGDKVEDVGDKIEDSVDN